MLNIALVIFALAALGGLYMATRVLRDQLAPWAISLLHALLGATGIILLLWTVIQTDGGNLLLWAVGLFIIAALGGFFLASFHARQKLPPKAVVVVHATVAVTAFVLLAVAVFAPAS